MARHHLRHAIATLISLFICPLFLLPATAQQRTPFCSSPKCVRTRRLLKSICDYIVKEKSTYPTIYVGGYYMRDLVDGYEIFGDRRYLDTAVAYGDALLKKQMANGFWPSGYGTVYLADTGSALGLFIALYKHVDRTRQKEYFNAIQRYVNSIEERGMILKNGALGVGWHHVENGVMTHPLRDQYTISSGLTGGEIFTWMYHMTGQDHYRQVAYNALKWILGTMRADGNIPLIIAWEGADWNKRGDPKNDFNLWQKWTYDASGYVGEGILSFDLYCNNPAWRAWVKKAVRPNIEFLLRTQAPDGIWSRPSQESGDWARSPEVVNYLIWYYEHVHRDRRVARAVRRFDAFIVKPTNGKYFGLLNDGAQPSSRRESGAFNTATSITGRALADIISPGVDSRW